MQNNMIELVNPKSKIAKYPRFLGKSEIIGNRRNIGIDDNNELPEYLKDLAATNIENFTKTYYEYFGAYPYIFETIAFALTQMTPAQRQDILEPIEDGLFFGIRFKWDTFKDYALDGMTNQTDDLLKSLYDAAAKPQGKIIPISPTQTVMTTPIRITIVYENGEKINETNIKKLANLKKINEKISPIKYVYVQCFTPFFADIIPKNQKNWIPIPKAFFAKMIDTQRKHANDKEFKNINVTGYPATYRKLFLYMFMHDNDFAKELNYDAIDLWKHVSPGEITYAKDKDGKEKPYLKRKESTRKFIYKANLLLNAMAREGYLEGVKFAPNRVYMDYEKQKYTVFVKRVPSDLKTYKQIEEMKIAPEILSD